MIAQPGRARADLHVHTKCSNRPSEWLARRIGAPESIVEPLEVLTCLPALPDDLEFPVVPLRA